MATIYLHGVPFCCSLCIAAAYQLLFELELQHGPAAVQLLR